MSLLIISAVIIVVLLSIVDLAELVQQSTHQKQIENFGVVRNCNPSIAICSITGIFNGNKIRLSLSINEPVYRDKFFPVYLSISGIKLNQIEKVHISLNAPGSNIQEYKNYLKMQSNNPGNLTSLWFSRLMIPRVIKESKDYLGKVEISVEKQIIQTTFQLQIKHIREPVSATGVESRK